MISKAVQHPYNDALFGGALTGYGGTDFFTAISFRSSCNLSPAGLMALLMSQPKYEVPIEISGFINDDHVQTESYCIFW